MISAGRDRSLRRADSADLAAGVAALQLVPANHEQAPDLMALAIEIAALPDNENGRPFSQSDWRARLGVDAPQTAGVPGRVFCEPVSFYGGSYLVCSHWEETLFALRHLTQALFLLPPAIADRKFLGRARQLCAALLGVSNALCERAGIVRGEPDLRRPGERVLVPTEADLAALKAAVTFDADALNEAAGADAVVALPACTSRQGAAGAHASSDAQLCASPLLEVHGGQTVVVAPRAIATALVHHLVSLADHHGLRREVAGRYRAAVWFTVARALDTLGMLPEHEAPPDPYAPVAQGVFAFDTDKVAHCLLVTDALEDWRAGHPFATWPTDSIADQIAERQVAVEGALVSGENPPNEILRVVVVGGIGRPTEIGFADPDPALGAPMVVLQAHELPVLADAEQSEPLVLWKWASALETLRLTCNVVSTDALSAFAAWRRNDQSYYLADDEPPTVLVIETHEGARLRHEVFAERDYHSVVTPDGRATIDVARATRNPREPLYLPWPLSTAPVRLLVASFAIPVWVEAQIPEDARRLAPVYVQYCEMIAYWLWQVSPSISGLVDSVAPHVRVLKVELRLAPSEAWLRDIGSGSNEIGACDVLAENAVALRLEAGAALAMAAPDNRGEREVVRLLLRGLGKLAPAAGLDEHSIECALEDHAPLGMKRKITRLPAERDPGLDAGVLPPARTVQEADSDEALDALARHLASIGYEPGPLGERVGQALNEAADFHAQSIAKLVGSLSPDGLLEWLIVQDEALTHRQAVMELTLATKLACYGDEPEIIARLARDVPELASAAVASRFLIEYVAAQPPAGIRPISAALYDRLLAHANELATRATLSDLIRSGVSDARISILPSRRLGRSHGDAYAAGRTRFLDDFAAEAVADSHSSFARRFTGGSPPSPDEIDELNAAVEVELGLPLEDLIAFLVGFEHFGAELDGEAKVADAKVVKSRVTEALEWDTPRAELALDLFTLRRRDDFWAPPSPFRREDVYPWRYTRPLSYVRRPIVARGPQLVWGNRHVARAGRYLVDLCAGGRLSPRTAPMRRLQAKHRHRAAEAFNEDVADVCEAQPDALVRRRVKKIGGRRIQRLNGDLLGDIDVLVALPRERTLLAVEAKDLALARTPSELQHSLEDTFGRGGRRQSALERHMERVAWLGEHVGEALYDLGINANAAAQWRVEGLIVVSEQALGPYVSDAPLPVLTMGQLRARLASGGTH